VNQIVVLEGLEPGDIVALADTTQWSERTDSSSTETEPGSRVGHPVPPMVLLAEAAILVLR
jgi:hypothetical protein